MKATLLTVCGFFIGLTMSFSQSLTLSIPHERVFVEESIVVDIMTQDFDSIASTQFSLSWNPDIISFDATETVDLDFVAVGNTNAAQGNINISWFDIDGEGKSLLDGQVFLRLNFTVIGEIGDLTPLNMHGDSLEIQIFRATSVPFQFQEISLADENGSVEIIDGVNPQNTFSITDTNIQDVACFGDFNGSIDLTGNLDNVTYVWTGPNSFSSTSLSIESLEVGLYTLNVFSSDGDLVFTNTYNVSGPLAELMVREITALPSDCTEASGSVQIEVVGGTLPYTINLDNGLQFSSGNITSLSVGSYPVTITDANNCAINTKFQIEQTNSVSLNLGEDIEACDGQVINLSAGDFAKYAWSTGDTSQNVEIQQAGDYIVTVTNDVGCSAIDTITVSIIEQIQLQFAQTDVMICAGDSIELTVSGGVHYEWIDPTDQLLDTQSKTITVSPSENIVYTVIAEGECGSDALEIPVTLFTSTATAGEDICIPTGETATLHASGGLFYYWSGSEYPLDFYNIARPTSTPEDSTQYFVMIIDENNCTTFDTVSVFIADDPISFIPHINMITPNSDGHNDVLDFGNIDKFGTNNFRVFNRWGKVVYEKLNYQTDDERFSGLFNGEPLPSGNYYYVLSFRDDQQIKQTLTIARED